MEGECSSDAFYDMLKEHGGNYANLIIIHKRSNRFHVVEVDDDANSQKVVTLKMDDTNRTVRVYMAKQSIKITPSFL